MREIKFRAWDNKINKWTRIVWVHTNDKGILNFSIKENEDIILEQFTGLYDKNGTDIYEGDILKWRNVTGYADGFAVMEWVESHSAFMLVNDDLDIYDECINFFPNEDVQVIGNIIESPELLNER